MTVLAQQPWPGNLRQLGQVLRKAQRLAGNGPIGVQHLGLCATPPPVAVIAAQFAATLIGPTGRRTRALACADVVAALEKSAGNRTQAAMALGVARRSLLRWLQGHPELYVHPVK